MLDIGNDALVLNGLQFLPNDFSRQDWIFAVVLEIPPIARLAHDVVAAAQRNVEALVARFPANDRSEFIRQLRVPRRGFGQRCGQCRSHALSAFAEIGDANPRADQIEVWDSQARNSGDKAVAPECSWDFRAKHRHASVDKLNFLIQPHLLHDQIGSLVGREPRVRPRLAGSLCGGETRP